MPSLPHLACTWHVRHERIRNLRSTPLVTNLVVLAMMKIGRGVDLCT